MFLVIATAWFFDSIDLGAMTFLLSPISHHFGLTATQTGVLGSASFAGMFFGAIGAGAIADRFGRQRVFKYSIVAWGLASIGLTLVWNFESLFTFRFLLGIGMGAEFPVAAAILAEFMPSSKRGRYAALLEGAWPIGFITAGAVSYVLVATAFGWRGFFAMQAVLAVVALILRRNLPESPRWLASRGHTAEAHRTLTAIEDAVQSATGQPLPDPEPVPDAHGDNAARGGFRALFVPARRGRTLTVWAVWFCVMTGYYGLTTWIGKLLTDRQWPRRRQEHRICPGHGPVGDSRISLRRVPDRTTGTPVLPRGIHRRLRNRRLLLRSELGNARTHRRWLVPAVLLFRHVLRHLRVHARLFPTHSRGAGVGSSTALGRLGSVFGPLAGPMLLGLGGTTLVFTTSAVLFAIGALIVLTRLPETKHAVLEQIS
jgi:putative MFS transporter